MRRGTTPTHKFTIPFVINNLSIISIVYSQYGKIVLEKATADCAVAKTDSNMIIGTALSETDTLKFDEGMVDIQIRLGDTDGGRYASNVIHTAMNSILKDGVLV